MIPEASLVEREGGLEPEGEGWFVVNARHAAWFRHDVFGAYCRFEGEQHFDQVGVNIHVLQPGQPNCMYHGESTQEDFLVLHGECLLLVEGEERRLQAWDFVHCAPATKHVFVGTGDGPCAILMVGARDPDDDILYPASEVARRHGAGVEQETANPQEAYAGFDRPARARLDHGGLPWGTPPGG